ncbi:DUF6261 family protein [Labilibacter marinus]|uniref:DUF6261 family protein n=1 Tax=Labilibacter marinus TaxID=1477105 RepID=UPI00094F931B|nr:DUF6261 family protein [Labilibacter marinus]
MERKQITPLLVSYVEMDEVNDLCATVQSQTEQFIADNANADAHFVAFIDVLNTQNALLTKSLNLERRLNDTVKVKKGDSNRDAYSTTLFGIASACAGSPIAEQAEAGELIYRIFKNHGGNPSRFSYEKQSSAMESIFANIDATGLAAIKTLKQMPLYEGMVQAQKQFKESEQARNADKALKQNTESASEVLKRVLMAYADVEDFLNLMVRIAPDTYTSIVEVLDSVVQGINTKARARNTHKKQEVE